MSTLDTTFAALSDPTRRAILSHLSKGEATVKELAKPFSMSQPAISRHLRVLEEAGLITRRVEGATRPCRLVPNSIEQMQEWLSALQKGLEANYARLDVILAEDQT